MGQKGNPIGFRTSVTKKWRSIWYGNKQEFGNLVVEDYLIRENLKKKPSCQGASHFTIRRMSGKIEVTIHTARPGLVIGKKEQRLIFSKRNCASSLIRKCGLKLRRSRDLI